MSETLEKAAAPAIGVSLQVTLDQARTLVLQTHVALTDGPGALNHVLDTVAASADRLEARYILVHRKRLLRQAEQNLEDTVAQQARNFEAAQQMWAEANPDRPFKAEGAAAADYQNAEKTIARFREEIEQHKAEVARLEELAK